MQIKLASNMQKLHYEVINNQINFKTIFLSIHYAAQTKVGFSSIRSYHQWVDYHS